MYSPISREQFRNADYTCSIHGENLVDGDSCAECGALKAELEARYTRHRELVEQAKHKAREKAWERKQTLMRELP